MTFKRNKSGFSLLELLTVMSIIAILAVSVAPAISSIAGSETTSAAGIISDTVTQARAYAMSMNTYVYIGIDQDNASSAAGSIVIGVIASSDGTQFFSATNATVPANSSYYQPISKLLKISNVKTVSLPSPNNPTNGTQRQVVPDSYKLGDPSFDQGLPAYSFSVGPYTFTTTSGALTATGVTSQGMLEIDPQGIVSETGGNPVPFFEIGLQPANGEKSNYAALQIAGLSGAVRLYRP